MSNGILERLDAIEKEVFANVCRNCTRPIPGKRHLAVFDRDDDGYPRCHECAGAVKLEGFGCYVWLDDGTLYDCEINDFEAHGIDYDYYGAASLTCVTRFWVQASASISSLDDNRNRSPFGALVLVLRHAAQSCLLGLAKL